jgi:hypothetical protein
VRRLILSLLSLACITTGVAFIYWPAAPIVAGALIALELATSGTVERPMRTR